MGRPSGLRLTKLFNGVRQTYRSDIGTHKVIGLRLWVERLTLLGDFSYLRNGCQVICFVEGCRTP